MTRNIHRAALVLAAITIGGGGCGLLLGFPDETVLETGTGGQGPLGSVASGGAGGDSSGNGGGAGASGDGGAGGGPIAPPFCDLADPSLVACYEFEMGVVDGSSYGNNASTQTNINYVPGKSGLALERGLTSVVTVPASASLNNVPFGTVEAWIKPSVIPPGLAGDMTPRAAIFDKNGQFQIFLYPGPTVRCGVPTSVYMASAVTVGQWMHIACVSDGVMVTMYIDGAPVITGSASMGSVVADILAIGADSPSGTADAYEGAIDSLRIWSVARSATQICQAAGGVSCP